MEILQLPRGTGKTGKILGWLVDAPPGETRVVMFHSARLRALACRSALTNRLGLRPWQFTTPGSFERDLEGRPLDEIVLGIDELDRVLAVLLRLPIRLGLATLTPDHLLEERDVTPRRQALPGRALPPHGDT